MEFRNFTREDWMGYAGCEYFSDGTSPLMCDGQEEFTVIADGMGINVDIYLWDEGYDNPVGVDSYAITQENAALCKTLAMGLLVEQMTAEKLLEMGFEHVTHQEWGRC